MSYEYTTLAAQLEAQRKLIVNLTERVRKLETASTLDSLGGSGGQIIPKEQINNAVVVAMEQRIQPQLDSLRRQITLNSDSGAEELVLNYRQRVNNHYNPDMKQLTDGKKSQSNRMTFFTDND